LIDKLLSYEFYIALQGGAKSNVTTMTISYTLSSQKYVDEGWTVWPRIAATKYNVDVQGDDEIMRKTNGTDDDQEVSIHQV
jgi:hypothetical protein